MNKAVIYARYSSEMQSDKSVEDQLYEAREYAKRNGYTVVKEYYDRAFSVSVLKPPGVEAILEDARTGKFNVLICEATDRLSRDQEHIAHIHKNLKFCGVRIESLLEGVVDEMVVAFKGYVNSNFNTQLAHKVRRGLKGRAIEGKPAGGYHYGYRAHKSISPKGTLITGDYFVVPEEAAVIRRTLTDYANGKSPLKICAELNHEGIPSPWGKKWWPMSFNGNGSAHNGLLNCEMFIGKYTWNKTARIKDPKTGKKTRRPKPESEWVVTEVPHLRIIDQDLWDRVKARQREMANKPSLRQKVRAVYLLSGLMKCGECGGNYIVTGADHVQCGNASLKGLCANKRSTRHKWLEQTVLKALEDEIMGENLAREFYDDYSARIESVQEKYQAERARHEAELQKTNSALEKLADSIIKGIDIDLIRDRMTSLGRKKEELTELLKTEFQTPTFLTSTIATVYRKGTKSLVTAFRTAETRDSSVSLLKSLITKVELTPTADRSDVVIDLHGNPQGILRLSHEHKTTKSHGATPLIVVPQLEQIKRLRSDEDSSESEMEPLWRAPCFNQPSYQMTADSGSGGFLNIGFLSDQASLRSGVDWATWFLT